MESLQSLNPNRSSSALRVLKAIILVIVLPWVYSFSSGFIAELLKIDYQTYSLFTLGIISFLVFYLFLFDLGEVYKKGQRITEVTFRFISPIVKTAPYVIPIYSVLLFLIYGFLSLFIQSIQFFNVFIFLLGFTIVFHLVWTARVLHSRKDDFLMINYLFSFSIIYILNILLLAFGFSALSQNFSWVSFSRSSFQICKEIFSFLFTQLFL